MNIFSFSDYVMNNKSISLSSLISPSLLKKQGSIKKIKLVMDNKRSCMLRGHMFVLVALSNVIVHIRKVRAGNVAFTLLGHVQYCPLYQDKIKLALTDNH